MYELETLVVPEELGVWLEDVELGEPGNYFTTIDKLFHYWDTVIGSKTGVFISQNKKEILEVIIGSRGYRIEKPTKYYVLDKYGVAMLRKNDMNIGGGVCKSAGVNIHAAVHRQDEEKYQLTEQEIKDYDERFWAFAEPVEENKNE